MSENYIEPIIKIAKGSAEAVERTANIAQNISNEICSQTKDCERRIGDFRNSVYEKLDKFSECLSVEVSEDVGTGEKITQRKTTAQILLSMQREQINQSKVIKDTAKLVKWISIAVGALVSADYGLQKLINLISKVL